MSWRLLTVERNGAVEPMIEVGRARWPLHPLLRDTNISEYRNTIDIVRNWPQSEPILDGIAQRLSSGKIPEMVVPEAVGRIMTPLRYPAKIVCSGTNYYDHLREMGIHDFDKARNRPLFFLKPPTTTLVGPGKTAPVPRITRQYDWEIELAAVIGVRARRVSAQRALDHVAGYAVALDLTARDLQRQPETAFKFDWYGGKCCDGSCPLGPAFVPARAIGSPQNLAMTLSVNGEVMQRSTTAEMIFSVAELVAAASEVLTLEPGDVILTGTPAGVGFPRGRFLKVGDRIDAEIERVGLLSIEMTEDPDDAAA